VVAIYINMYTAASMFVRELQMEIEPTPCCSMMNILPTLEMSNYRRDTKGE